MKLKDFSKNTPESTIERIVQTLSDGGEGVYANSTIVDCTGDEPEIIRQGIGELQ